MFLALTKTNSVLNCCHFQCRLILPLRLAAMLTAPQVLGWTLLNLSREQILAPDFLALFV